MCANFEPPLPAIFKDIDIFLSSFVLCINLISAVQGQTNATLNKNNQYGGKFDKMCIIFNYFWIEIPNSFYMVSYFALNDQL